MSVGLWIWFLVCVVSGSLLGWYGNRDSFTRLKWWIVWKVTPWFEEKASLDLEWRTYAQKHNAAGKRPRCVYEGMENDLDPDEKVEVYEFPGGDPDAPPDCLIEAQARATKQKGLMRRKTAGLDADN